MVITPEGEEATKLTWWIKNRETPKKLILGAQHALVLVPFWVLANDAVRRRARGGAEPSDATRLVYVTASVPVPSVAAMAKGVRSGAKTNLTLRVLCTASEDKLTKGDRICLSEGPPSELPATRLA